MHFKIEGHFFRLSLVKSLLGEVVVWFKAETNFMLVYFV